MQELNGGKIPLYFRNIGQTLNKIEKDIYKPLEAGETYLNTSNRHLLYRVEYLNALGQFQAVYDILKPAESLTKTNPVNKVKIYI